LDLVFPALVCQPIPGGLYDLYDEYGNDGEQVLVTEFALFTGSPRPICFTRTNAADSWVSPGG